MTVLPHSRHRLRRAAALLRQDLEQNQVANRVLARRLCVYLNVAAENDSDSEDNWLGGLAMLVFEDEVRGLFARLELQ